MKTIEKLSAETVYEQLSQNLRATDEVSFKLLGIVPLATLISLTSIFVKRDIVSWSPSIYLFGALGALLVWGIFRWELRNIQRCLWYCELLDEMEKNFNDGIPRMKDRYPKPSFLGFEMGKTQAEKIIYFILILTWLLFPIIIKLTASSNGWKEWPEILYCIFSALLIIATIISSNVSLKKEEITEANTV